MASSLDVMIVSNRWWDLICSKVKDALIFIDKGAAECLHWNGGIIRLIDSGAVAVKEFQSFEVSEDHVKRVVFLLSRPIWRMTQNILHEIIHKTKPTQCVIITSISPPVYHLTKYGQWDSTLGTNENQKDPFRELKDMLLNWMGNKNYVAEILYVPLLTVSLCPNVFVTPAFADLGPPLNSSIDLLRAHSNENSHGKSDGKTVNSSEDIDFGFLPLELQVMIEQFVTNFNGLLEMLNAREDLYSLGPFSRIVTTQLEQMSSARARRKLAPNKTSLLFVDRTLDLGQSTSFEFETLLERILHLLPKIKDHTIDVMIDISPLTSVKSNSFDGGSVIVPGCLAYCNEPVKASVLNSMITNKQKESVMEINRNLVNVMSKKGFPLGDVSKFGRVTPESLLVHVLKFK